MNQIQERCECRYNKHCHPMRQKLQIWFRAESHWYNRVDQCDFYKKLQQLEEKKGL